MSKNKTQTISVSTLVKKLLRVYNFLLFNDLPSYLSCRSLELHTIEGGHCLRGNVSVM